MLDSLRTHLGKLDPYVDGFVAAGFFVFAILIYTGDLGTEAGFRNPDAFSVLLLGVQTLPLALRRRFPVTVFLVAFAAVILHTAFGYPSNGAGKLATVVAFFTVVERMDFKVSLLASAGVFVGLGLFYGTTREEVENPWELALDAIVAFTGAWMLGTFARTRRQQSERDAENLVRLERERDTIARLATAQERTAIARELHDAVGHALNLIVIQASASRRVYETQPDKSIDALAAIESAGRQALTDMDRMLGLLREEGVNADESQRAPGIDDIDALIGHTVEAGLPVEKTVSGERVRLPQTIDQSVYRIVQEALTNCLKHAGRARAIVELRYLDDAIEVSVKDDGAGPKQPPRSGRGLIGMRERVRLFGGDFIAGSRPGGGFQVEARIPFAAVQQ